MRRLAPLVRPPWLLVGGMLLGAAAAILAPATSGCVYHDTCIMVTSPGEDWCRNVAPGSLAHALGLRTGDVLESIDERTIHDLDAALQAYAQLADADTVSVLVKRGTRWLDFTYTFVP